MILDRRVTPLMLSHLQAFIIGGGFGHGQSLSSVLTLLPGTSRWTSLSSLPRTLDGARASIVAGKMRLSGGFDGSSYRSEVSIWKKINYLVWLKSWVCMGMMLYIPMFACQVLKYEPEPSNQWTTAGQIETNRHNHAVLSITPELLPCQEGSFPVQINKTRMYERIMCKK